MPHIRKATCVVLSAFISLLFIAGCDSSAPAALLTSDPGAAATSGAAQAQAVQTQVAIQVPAALTSIASSVTPTIPPSRTPIPTPTSIPTATSTATVTAAPSATPTEKSAPSPTPLAPPPSATASPTALLPPPVPTSLPIPQISGVIAVPICIQPCTDRSSHEILLASLSGLTLPSTRVLAHAATDPSFQVDGRRLVFHSLADSQTGRAEGIFISDLPSNTEIRVDGAPDDYWPVFINHGWVLYSSTRVEVNQKKEYRLFITTRYNSEDAPQSVGSDQITVLKDARFPAYFPGGLIAYSGCVGGGCGIWTTTERGYAPPDACCQVSRGASDTAPDWSPDGTRIAFISREDGNFEIYVINSNGTDRTRLTHTAATNVAPAWSPDGQWIAYLSDRSGTWAVWLVRPDRPDQTVMLFYIQGTIDDAPNRRMDWAASP